MTNISELNHPEFVDLSRLAQQGDEDTQKQLDEWWHNEVEQQDRAVDHNPAYTVEDYIAEALGFDDDDLDHGEDHTAASVCRI